MIVIATILNGSLLLTKRIGLTNFSVYQQLKNSEILFEKHFQEFKSNPLMFDRGKLNQYKKQFTEHKTAVSNYLYTTSSKLGMVLKLAKFIAVLVLIVYGLRLNSPLKLLSREKLLTGFFLWIILCVILNYSGNDLQQFVSAAYIYSFLIIAFLLSVTPISRILEKLSDFKVLCLLALFIIGISELWFGLKIYSTNSIFNKRIVGFFNQPSTLGIYSICICSLYFAYNFRPGNLIKPFITLVFTGFLIVFSGSNTAAVAFLALLTMSFQRQSKYKNIRSHFKVTMITIAITCIIVILVGRYTLDSLFGRLEKYQYYFSQDYSLWDYLIGQGVGIGSNTLHQIRYIFPFESFTDIPIKFSTDSTPLLLIIQIGIIGCVLFYGILIKAMIKDQHLRLVYLVFILCSLTINIIEVFPLNIVLGLMLAKSFSELPMVDNSQKKFAET